MRALSCSFPNKDSRENLINLLSEIRQKDIEESKLALNGSKLKIETVGDSRFLNFFYCFARL